MRVSKVGARCRKVEATSSVGMRGRKMRPARGRGARHLKVARIPRVAVRCYRAYVAPPNPSPRTPHNRSLGPSQTIAHLLKQKTCSYGYQVPRSRRGTGCDEIYSRLVFSKRSRGATFQETFYNT